MVFHINKGRILDSDGKKVGEVETGQFVHIENEIGTSYEGWYDGEDGGCPVLKMCTVTTPDGETAIDMGRSVRIPHLIILVKTCEQTISTISAIRWLEELKKGTAGGMVPTRRRD